MNAIDQRAPAITFYTAIPGCRSPIRADPSVLGTLPARGFQYCEALRAASSFGWYVFPPIDFTLQWDGSQVIWTYRGAKAWYPLTSAQFPGYQARFDRIAPRRLRGFSPPFLTAMTEPGIVQVWTGLMIESTEDWSVLVRPPANLPRNLAYDLYEASSRPTAGSARSSPISALSRPTGRSTSAPRFHWCRCNPCTAARMPTKCSRISA